MDNIALLILGVFISFLGIVNMTGNISTIHSYNRRKVKEEDVPKYGRAVGTGTLIIGVSLIAAFVTTFWSEKAMYFIVIPALVIGLGFILCFYRTGTSPAHSPAAGAKAGANSADACPGCRDSTLAPKAAHSGSQGA